MVGLGTLRTILGAPPQATVVPAAVPGETFGLLLLMRAFADGCSAMTGAEAVATAFRSSATRGSERAHGHADRGDPARYPLSGDLVPGAGRGCVARGRRRIRPLADRTRRLRSGAVVVGPAVLDDGHPDPCRADELRRLPRVASLLARDGYLPRQFAFRGERLAFNAGIVVLAAVSILLIVAFQGQVEALIPLYAIGVFTAFTLSQSGMVRHWITQHGTGWRRSALLNGAGPHYRRRGRHLRNRQVHPWRVDRHRGHAGLIGSCCSSIVRTGSRPGPLRCGHAHGPIVRPRTRPGGRAGLHPRRRAGHFRWTVDGAPGRGGPRDRRSLRGRSVS